MDKTREIIKKFRELNGKTITAKDLIWFKKELSKKQSLSGLSGILQTIKTTISNLYDEKGNFKFDMTHGMLDKLMKAETGFDSKSIQNLVKKKDPIAEVKKKDQKEQQTNKKELVMKKQAENSIPISGRSGAVSSTSLAGNKYDIIPLPGKYRRLLGEVSYPFRAMVYGRAGSGKSTFCIDLARLFSKELKCRVLYVSAEEGTGHTFTDKLRRLDAFNDNLFIINHMPDDLSGWDIVFLDTVNELKIDISQAQALLKKYSGKVKGFFLIYKSTKAGSYRGVTDNEHLVDITLRVDTGIVYVDKSRYGGSGSMVVFVPDQAGIQKFTSLPEAEKNRAKCVESMYLMHGPDGKFWMLSKGQADIYQEQGYKIL